LGQILDHERPDNINILSIYSFNNI
jgi:hypothetical protein